LFWGFYLAEKNNLVERDITGTGEGKHTAGK